MPEASLRELLLMLLGPDLQRRWMMMHMSNNELLKRYDTELVLKIRNKRNLMYDRQLPSYAGYAYRRQSTTGHCVAFK